MTQNPRKSASRPVGAGPRTLRGDVRSLAERFPRTTKAVALGLVALSALGVVRAVEALDGRSDALIRAQNERALDEVTGYVDGKLRIEPGVRVYGAPDTEGGHYEEGSGQFVHGNEQLDHTTEKPFEVANPVEYPDPDGGETWYGFVRDPEAQDGGMGWVHGAVLEQTDESGNPYATWVVAGPSVESVQVVGGIPVDPAKSVENGSPALLGSMTELPQG